MWINIGIYWHLIVTMLQKITLKIYPKNYLSASVARVWRYRNLIITIIIITIGANLRSEFGLLLLLNI